MVREEKVKMMSKTAIYEKGKGKKEIAAHEYYKGDFVRIRSLKAVVSASIAFALIVGIVAFYKMDDILANVFKIDYKQMAIRVLIVYVAWIFIYWLISRIVYARIYEKSRSNIIQYNYRLKKLQESDDKEMTNHAKGGVEIGNDIIEF